MNITNKTTAQAAKIPSGALWGIVTLIIVAIIFGVIAAAKNKGTSPDGNGTANASTTPVTITVNDKDWIRDNPNAKVTLVEYSDFQCPACAAFESVLETFVHPKYKDDIRFVYRHFPLSQHQNAVPAARAAEAAGNQGKFWEMHDLLFKNQTKWSELTDSAAVTKIFMGYADELKLDLVTFATDMKSSATDRAIQADTNQGLEFGINSTPTFYLNDVKMTSFSSFEEFVNLIDAEVKKSKLAESTGTSTDASAAAANALNTTSATSSTDTSNE